MGKKQQDPKNLEFLLEAERVMDKKTQIQVQPEADGHGMFRVSSGCLNSRDQEQRGVSWVVV